MVRAKDRPQLEGAASARWRAPSLGLLVVLAGVALLGWAVARHLRAKPHGGGERDAAGVTALVLLAGGIAWAWWRGERARRHAAERSLVAEAFRERAEILAALDDSVIATDAGGRIVSWSPSATRTYGYGEAEALGGEIRVQSEVGAGSTFTVLLPAAAARPAIAAEEAAASPPPSPATPAPGAAPAPTGDPGAGPSPAASTAASRRGRVLVVDDEPGIGAAIRRVLRRDHDVVAATSGREALDFIHSETEFDAVLCDVMMPELTGMELYRMLRAELPALAERVVFMSGGAFTPEAQAFLSEVPNRRIGKPFDPGALRAVVACLVAGADGSASSA